MNPLKTLIANTILVIVPFAISPSAKAQPIDDGHAAATPVASGSGPELNIFTYLDEVRDKHDGYKGAKVEKEAATLHGFESHLLISPTLFANAQTTNDKKPGTLFLYNNEVTNQYQLGVSQTTTYGLSGRLYYSAVDTSYNNLQFGGPTAVNLHTVQTSPVLELTLSLWRNWLGAEVNGQIEQGDAQNKSTRSTETFQMRNLLVQAALAYWNLDLVRETVRVQQDAVTRNSQLLQWHKRRVSDGLGDKADVLQADAALQVSLVALKTTQDQETAAARTFNLSRGYDAPSVTEKLMPMTADVIDRLHPPKRKLLRDDVEAAYFSLQVTKAAAALSQQKYKPTLELFGSAAMNNTNPTDLSGAAYTDAFNTSRPTTMIGVRLNAPLNLGLVDDVKNGWEKEKASADLTYKRKLLEQDYDWDNLNDKFRQAQERFHMYVDLEKKQKEKFDYERSRRTAGRTTTEQVLLFENDFEAAQYSRIQSLSDIFTVYSQMKLYEEVADESR